jgi:hypothetical protein
MFQYFLINAQSGSTDKNASDIIRRWLEAPDALRRLVATSVILIKVYPEAHGHED